MTSSYISILSMAIAALSCALSLAVAIRVKRLLDPLTEQGTLSAALTSSALVGETIPDLGVMTDIHGEVIGLPMPGGDPWILTFQSTGCPGCKQQLPRYKRYLESLGIGRDRVFSIVNGDPEEMDVYRDELDPVSRIIHADDAVDELARRLGVSTWPTYLVVSGSGSVSFSAGSSTLLASSVPSLRSSEKGLVAP